ncbi:MAG: molybdenum cofactor biosynthesis protein MoaE [Firmicutes bacterium]|nr:molybdenum cofactor biosynthesis protein MoaE [Bacillota bacterium]
MDVVRIQDAPIEVAPALRAIADPSCGGQVIFLGTVRDSFEGRKSQGLFYEAYRELAEKEMRRIAEELKQEYAIRHVALIHRVGELRLEEVAVLVAVSAAHREAAFLACQAGIDRIKRRVPIWKKERWAEGEASWHDDPEARLT